MAGTLVIDTLKSSTSGPPAFQNTSGTEVGQLCRAWVNFNGVTTATIRASFNVSSVTRNATGDYTVNFTNSLADANYSTAATCEDVSGGGAGFTSALLLYSSTAQTTSNVRVRCRGENGNVKDCSVGSVSIFR